MGRAHLVLSGVVICLLRTAAIAAAQAPPPDGWVVLPVDEYRALRERANPAPPAPAPPPVDATITRIDYDLRVDTEVVTGRAVLTIDVLRDGWTRVPIPAGLMARAATLDGQPVALVDTPQRAVLLPHAGRSTLTLEIVIPLTASAGAESIALPASPAPITRVTLALPKSGVDLTAAGGLIAEHTEATNESRWTAFGRPAQALALTWKRKVDDRRAEQPLRVRARVTELAGLGDDACQISAAVRVEVLQGLAREVGIAIPAGLVVNEVNGATIADWDASSGNLLRVRLLEPTATEISLVVSGDTKTPRDGSIAIPLVRVPAAERETGGVAVDVAGAGEISGRTLRGLEPADPSELGDLVSGRESPSMIAFRHRPLAGTDVRSLTVAVVRYTPQAVFIANVEEARYRALASEDGRLLVEARYAVRNNQRSFLKATLPAGATVWSAEVGGRPIRPGVAEANAILLPLLKGRAGEEAPTFVVELLYLQQVDAWIDKSHPHVELPALDLPVSRTGLELHYSPRFRLDVQHGSFRVDSDPGPFAAALRAPAAPPPPSASATSPPAPARPPARVGGQLQALVDRFKNDGGGRTIVGSLPVRATFPSIGPSIFLASELTAEATAPAVDLIVRRAK
jgi:hypothetical protein